MNLTDEAVLQYIIKKFPRELEDKFRAGMAKYNSPLLEKDCLAEAIPEVKDLVVYLAGAQLQKERVWELIEANEDLFHVDGEAYGVFNELKKLLEPKPLAKKKKASEEATQKAATAEAIDSLRWS